MLVLGYVLLSQSWPYAQRWIILAALVQIYSLGLLWLHLPLNRRQEEQTLLAKLGIANHLTLMRGLIASLIAGFLFSPWPTGALAWLPFLLYLASYILDYLDGFYARLNDQVYALRR